MRTLRIELDASTDEALTALAEARGTAPADLAAEIVAKYVGERGAPWSPDAPNRLTGIPISELPEVLRRKAEYLAAGGSVRPDPIDALVGKYLGRQVDRDSHGDSIRRHDPLDAIVGSIDADPVDDIDEVIYGR